MKKSKLFFFATILAALALAGCADKIKDEMDKGWKEAEEYNVDFTYKVVDGAKVSFTNTSDDRLAASRFTWYFGEEAYVEKVRDCTYTFKTSGTHTVTLKATLPSGYKKSTSHDIAVTVPSAQEPTPQPTPTKIYIRGIKYLAVDVQLDYYKARLIDDDLFTTTWFDTDYTAMFLYSNNMPYTQLFSSRVLMNGLADDNYYTLFVYRSETGEDSGTQCLKQNIYTSKFRTALSEQSPYIEVHNNSGNTVVQLLLEYE